MTRDWKKIRKVLKGLNVGGEIFLSLINNEGGIICMNSCMIKKLHLDNPRLKSINIYDIIHPVNIQAFRSQLQYCEQETGNSNLELYLKNGHYHPMRWQIRKLESVEKSSKFVCVGQTLQEHRPGLPTQVNGYDTVAGGIDEKHSQDNHINGNTTHRVAGPGDPVQGERTEELVRNFMLQTPNLSWIVDEDAKLIFASKAFYDFFNLRKEQAVFQDIVTLLPAVVSDALYLKHLQVKESGKPLEFIENTGLSNGKNIAFHIHIFPVQGSDGKKYIGGSAVDLKERFAIEKMLQEANNRLLMITRATTDAIWEWDMQNDKVFRNDALMDLIGYSQEDNKGLSWWFRRIHPVDRYRVTNKIKKSVEKIESSWEDEYRFKCADGSYKHIRDKRYIVYENDLPVRMIGSLQDISMLKQLENSLMEEKLERQKEISETVVQVQEKERTRIGLELHDNVNQILSTTKLFLELLTPESNGQADIKQKSIEFITLAIEEIRKLSKELVIPQMHNKRLEDSISSIIRDIQVTTNLKIVFEFDEVNELLSAGKKLTIFRIVQEQLKNILKHSEASEVEIKLKNGEYLVCLVIKDNGKGFDTTALRTGIGLSNIFERTRFYNGTCVINSSPGQGCVLNVSIPFEG